MSVQQRVRALQQHLESGPLRTPEEPTPVSIMQTIKGAAHHLDATLACPRKYWLEHIKGWTTEPFFLPGSAVEHINEDWPKATDFGLMMHRVLEIGLRNPLNIGASTPPLEPSWLHESEDDLASPSTVARVMNEFGFGLEQTDGRPEAAWRDRLLHLGSLIDEGLLGRWVSGETVNGWTVEAVRTELPFFHKETLSMEDPTMQALVSPSEQSGAQVDGVNMEFNGRADLVLALVNEDGQGALQVVDLKTKGCLEKFNEADPAKGHPLQQQPPTNLSVKPATPQEQALLDEHRLQLTLYAMALEAIEQRKPDHLQRVVLPPSLLLGANGRVIQLTGDEYKQAKTALRNHLKWRSAVHLNPHLEEPARLPEGSTTCGLCPFYRGDIRRCGPVGEPLGMRDLSS